MGKGKLINVYKSLVICDKKAVGLNYPHVISEKRN